MCRASLGVGRPVYGPGGIRPPGVGDEEHPLTVWQATHDLHAVVVDFNGLAVRVRASDSPLRPAQGKVARYRRMVHDDIHVRFDPDITRHRLADALGTTRHNSAVVHLFQTHDTRVR